MYKNGLVKQTKLNIPQLMATKTDSDLNQTNIQFPNYVLNLMRLEYFIILSNEAEVNV